MFFLKDLPTREMISGYAQALNVVDVQKTNDALHMLRQASLLIRPRILIMFCAECAEQKIEQI